MPELDLQLSEIVRKQLIDPPAKKTRELGALWMRLVSICAFPSDEQKRETFQSAWTMAQIDDQSILERLGPVGVLPGAKEYASSNLEAFVREDFWRDSYSDRDLARANIEKIEKEARSGMKQATWAGHQLWLLYDLAQSGAKLEGEPSISKVQWFLSENQGSRSPSIDSLRKALSSARSVAHIIAGLEYCRAFLVPRTSSNEVIGAETFEDRLIGYWLAASRAFQDFALKWESSRSTSQTRNFVSANDIWLLPDDLILPEIEALSARELSDIHLKLLNGYQRRSR